MAHPHRGAPGLREDLLEMMNNLDRAAELEWGRLVSLPEAERADQFATLARVHRCSQTLDSDRLVWLDDAGRIEAQFCFVDEPQRLHPFLDIYRIKIDLLPNDRRGVLPSDHIGVSVRL